MVGSGRVVGWLDNLEIMLNSVQLSWKLTELGNKSDEKKKVDPVMNNSGTNCEYDENKS